MLKVLNISSLCPQKEKSIANISERMMMIGVWNVWNLEKCVWWKIRYSVCAGFWGNCVNWKKRVEFRPESKTQLWRYWNSRPPDWRNFSNTPVPKTGGRYILQSKVHAYTHPWALRRRSETTCRKRAARPDNWTRRLCPRRWRRRRLSPRPTTCTAGVWWPVDKSLSSAERPPSSAPPPSRLTAAGRLRPTSWKPR